MLEEEPLIAGLAGLILVVFAALFVLIVHVQHCGIAAECDVADG